MGGRLETPALDDDCSVAGNNIGTEIPAHTIRKRYAAESQVK